MDEPTALGWQLRLMVVQAAVLLLAGSAGGVLSDRTDLPRSTPAVEASRPVVPFDTADPLFRFGDGITLGAEVRAST